MFKTPRLLLEVQSDGWKPARIYCNFETVHAMMDALPRIAKQYGGLENVRVKYLETHDQIADAKLAIYRLEHNGKG